MRVPRRARLCAQLVILAFTASCIDTGAPTQDVPSSPDGSRVKWILIDPATATVPPGGSVALDLSLQDDAGREVAGPAVTWASSDTSVATVTSDGVVTAHKTGTANVTASSGARSAYSVINVSTAPPPTLFVSITPAPVQVAAHSTVQLFPSVTDGGGHIMPDVRVAWSSKDTTIATVSASGMVTGVKAGATTVIAKAGTNSSSVSVTVVDAPQPTT
ncbi:MAG: Ig-like domain-containing protein, partial [Gemmatimonadaceae bacterium]|nr:Ig-like domain-containing protein [Gemmatimonadaceae bacterium]